MTLPMAESKKLQANVPVHIKRALAIRAATVGVEIGDLIAQLVEANYPREVESARQALQAGAETTSRRGRKPKQE